MFVHDQLQISDSKSVSGEGGPRLYLLNNYGLTAPPEEAYLFSNFTISLSGISLMVKQTDLTGARGGTWWGAVCGHVGVDWRCVDILDLIDQPNCFSSQQFYKVGIRWSDHQIFQKLPQSLKFLLAKENPKESPVVVWILTGWKKTKQKKHKDN